jgi:hypothetical protein
MRTVTFLIFVLINFMLFSWSCNSSSDTNQLDNDSINNMDSLNEHTKKVKKIFYNVPSPIEMTSVIKNSGALYKPEILNSFKVADKYVNIPQQALNLGVYGSDLSYVRLFDQIQLSINYLSAIKKLCDELNIPEEQGSFAINRMEKNMDNKDSLLQIISDTYSSADAYLKDNDRGNTATLIIVGGWIEALYISTNIIVFENSKNKEVVDRIAEQKYSLSNLIELIKSYPNDNELQSYIQPLLELKKVYDQVGIEYIKGDVVTEKEKKLTTIHSKAIVTIDKNTFDEIKKTVADIRKKVISN